MIAIFDYGAGNLRSVQNTLGELGCEYTLVRDAAGLLAASKILLPGVGHFGQMMRALDALGVRETLVERIRAGVPFLGICLGMQALFETQRRPRKCAGWASIRARWGAFRGRARAAHGLERARSARPSLSCCITWRAPLRLFRPQLLCARITRWPAPPALTK